MLVSLKKSTNLLLVFLLLSFCILYAHNLAGWLIHDDEGGYLYQAWRMSEGEAPYRDFYTPKEPLFLFTGYIIFKLFGPDIFGVRMFSVIATILTAYLIFLIGRRLNYSYKVSFSALIIYLILPVVYYQGRLFRSDAHVVFFSTLGLFLFVKAWQSKNRLFFLYSGVFYAVSLGYKLAAILGVGALVLFLIYQALIERKISVFSRPFIPFISGFLVTAGIILVITYSIAPSFLDCLIGHQIRQPLLAPGHALTTAQNNINGFFMIHPRQYGLRGTHSWIIICALPVVIGYLFIKRDLRKIFAFYIFSMGFLILNPYPGEILRYLLYFLPVAVLVFAGAIFYFLDHKRPVLARICGFAAVLFISANMLIPDLIIDNVISTAKEGGTLAFAGYIKNHTASNDYVVTDYGDLLFHARRKTTPLMAAMSKSAVDNGVITSDKLINEIEKYRVKMIIIHREGVIDKVLGYYLGNLFEAHHFKTLLDSSDGPEFLAYLRGHYRFIADYNRSGQVYAVYARKENSQR